MSNVTKKIKILGMHCSSCAMNIDFDLEDMEGVNYSKTSFTKQESEVSFDPTKTNIEDIIGCIKKTGYRAQLLP